MSQYYNEKEAHRFVWWAGRVWQDSGLRNVHGCVHLIDVKDRSKGVTVDPAGVRPVEGKALEACKQKWGAA